MTNGWKDVVTLIRIVTVVAFVAPIMTFSTDLYQVVFRPVMPILLIPEERQNIGLWSLLMLFAMLSAAWFTWPRRSKSRHIP